MANKKKILIVEDDYSVASALEMKITSAGYEVVTAKDGEEGLNKATALHPDLILLDIILPKIDGMTLLTELRKDDWGKTAKVIILSNLGTGDELAQSKEKNVKDFLVKTDWSMEDVVKKIKENLE